MKKLKYILSTVFCMTFLLPTYIFAINVKIDELSVNFNQDTGYPIIDENSRTLVPLRITMETFGAEVSWNQESQKAVVKRDGIQVEVPIDSELIIKNGEEIKNDTKAKIVNNRVYLPIRAVLECYDAIVSFDNLTKTVVINSQCNATLIYQIEHNGTPITNYWKIYTEAENSKVSGDYKNAISKYIQVVPNFLKEGNSINLALLFGNLGECYAKSSEYDKAKECWMREAYYWKKINSTQEVISAKRKVDYIKSTVEIYAKQIGKSKEFNTAVKTGNGILLGIYAENDESLVDNIYDSYIDTIENKTGRDHAGYLFYLTYKDANIRDYESVIKKAKEKGKIIQIALQPLKGLDEVNENDEFLINMAKYMEESGVKFFLRFAGEMNEVSAPWYTKDTAKYISKFRIVSRVMKQYAPTAVSMVWAPNFYPPDNITSYYPGDEYVDFVGMSSYYNYSVEQDPLNQGIDRARWSSQFDYIYSLYGNKKPIIVAEGGASYIEYNSKADITDIAMKQLKDFYTYLPIKYPNLKAFFYFDNDETNRKFKIFGNEKVTETYKNGIQTEGFLGDVTENYEYIYKKIFANSISKNAKELCSYIKFADLDKISKIEYYINGVLVGSSNSAPYRINCDVAQYIGQEIFINVKVYDKGNNLLINKTAPVKIMD